MSSIVRKKNVMQALHTPTKVPPIKTQGIKTKLVEFISESVRWSWDGKWIEPFLGSGVVLFNMLPKKALGADTNVHIINLYRSIQSGSTTSRFVRRFLELEGARLESRGESHYYEIRDRFNRNGDPLDFLFLNRACFNGLMRFNSKGGFNVPFCRKPGRFSKSYITKITNQVGWLASLLENRKGWEFMPIDWQDTMKRVGKGDFVYLDPPYNGRHTSYYDTWGEADMAGLAQFLTKSECSFALSLWYENRYRKNEDIKRYFSGFRISRHEHFYHVGSTEELRNKMTEALITRT